MTISALYPGSSFPISRLGVVAALPVVRPRITCCIVRGVWFRGSLPPCNAMPAIAVGGERLKGDT
ncbi:MAG TPA: hypothetical protein PLY78_11800 [Methanospirillum sp.]|nr:hypothetical protein [Methanospirillum sp.]